METQSAASMRPRLPAGQALACAGIMASLFACPLHAQVQAGVDLRFRQKLLGVENFGGESRDVAGLTVHAGREVLAVSSWRRGADCPADATLLIYSRPGPGSPWTLDDAFTPLIPGSHVRPPRAVALSGDTMVVGGFDLEYTAAFDPGFVLIYRRDAETGRWQQVQRIEYQPDASPDRDDCAGFGYSVDIDGDLLVIGTPFRDNFCQQGGNRDSGIGAAFVFARDPSTGLWSRRSMLVPSDGDHRDHFGADVSIDGNSILVGAPGHRSESPAKTTGAAYLFDPVDGSCQTCLEHAKIVFPPDWPSDTGSVGSQVAISDSSAVISDGDFVGFYGRSSGMLHHFLHGSMRFPSPVGASDLDLETAPGGEVCAFSHRGHLRVFNLQEGWYDLGTGFASITLVVDGIQGVETSHLATHGGTVVVGAPLDNGGGDRTGSIHTFVGTADDPFSWQSDAAATPLIPGAAAADERFGSAIDIDGDRMIVGTPNDVGCAGSSGAASVFRLEDDRWQLEGRLTAPDVAAVGSFAWSVAIDGDIAVVGAPNDQPNGPDSGSVYVFARGIGGWTQEQKIIPPDGGEDHLFGWDVAIDGDTLLIGAPGAGGNPGAGQAYVYRRDATGWAPERILTGLVSLGLDEFGHQVALDARFAVVAAPGTIGHSGAAYVYARANWSELSRLTADNPAVEKYFGSQVTLAGDHLLVSAHNAGAGRGEVHAFALANGVFQHRQTLLPSTAGTSSLFGVTLAADDVFALIGAVTTEPDGTDVFDAHFFTFEGTTWREITTIRHPDNSGGAAFWRSLALDGRNLAIGVPIAAENAGAVFSYDFDVDWTVPECPANVRADEIARIIDDEPAVADETGSSVDVSGDVAVVGIRYKELPGTVNGNPTVFVNAGALLIFERTGPAQWSFRQRITPSGKDGQNLTNSLYGDAVALDGDILAVGSYLKEEAQVYVRDGDQFVHRATLTDNVSSLVNFGAAVGVDGERIAVGAWGSSPGSITGGGIVWIFDNVLQPDGSFEWQRSSPIVPAGVAFGDHFGQAVALSGDRLVVGVKDDDDGTIIDAGAVYLFERDEAGNWIEHPAVFQAPVPDRHHSARLGASVDIDGDVFVAGAPYAYLAQTNQRAGAAYVWRRNPATGAWDFEQKLVPADLRSGDLFGSDVAIENNTIVVGAPTARKSLNAVPEGAVYVFNYDPAMSLWTERHTIFASNGQSGDHFGASVALAGGNLWVGAPFADDDPNNPANLNFNSGAAYTFDLACLGIRGDCDDDGDIDANDRACFFQCASGPAVPLTPGCEEFDFDGDDDVDQDDYAVIQRCFSGQNIPADPNCA